jgi:hypothetical protein
VIFAVAVAVFVIYLATARPDIQKPATPIQVGHL